MSDQLDADKVPTSDVTPVISTTTNQMNGTCNKVSKKLVDNEKYQIKNGVAVVMNNIEFERHLNLPDRKGSDVDASSLFQRFQELGFDSHLLNDATTNDVNDKIKEIKEENDNLKKTDCLVFVLLTHGNEDHIFLTDGDMKIKALMDKFNAENCPELMMKPKIFIFQACRGLDIGRGVNARIIRERSKDPNQSDAKMEPEEYDEIYGDIIRIPNEADFLAVYSSSSGYGSFRNTENGSPFVRVLSDELLQMRPGEDFYKVLTRVNRQVGTGYKPNYPNRDDITQMPCFISHLTKDLILKE